MIAQIDLPAPLVPHDIDVDGINGFLLHTDRLFHSELWALSTGDEFKAAVALWGHAWRQKPAGSLPNDDRLLAAFSGAGPRWKRVRAMALRGFELCSDGRLYHRVLCEDVLRAAQAKDRRKERTSAATRARQSRGDDGSPPPRGGKKANGINESGDRNVGRNEHRNEERHDQRNGDRNDVRHEQRDVHVTADTGGPLRSPIEVEGEEKKKENIPAAACSPVRREAPPPDAWATRENFDRVERRCRAVLPKDWVNDLVVGPMARLEADGLDLEAEIVPTLLDLVASRRTPIRTWGMLANAVAERVAAQREARAAQGLPAKAAAPPKPEEQIELGSPFGAYAESVLRVFVEKHRGGAGWMDHLLGPAPGAPGCRIPARLLIGEAA